ncbi:MAG: HAMP domain-containing sensor histidine kinase [Ilumatobacteraceae bacterium]
MRRRLALMIGGLFAVVVVVYGALTFWLAGTNVRGAIDDQLAEQADSVESLLLDDRRPLVPDFVGRTADRLNETTFSVQLIGPDGAVEGDPDLPFDETTVEQALSTSGDQFRTIELDGRSYRMITRGVGSTVLQLATDVDSIEDGLRGLRGGLFLMGLVGIGVAGLVGWLVARSFTRPIVDVTRAAAQLAEQRELPQPIATDRRDEVGQLADSFNELLAELEVSQRQQERLVADASHELRTPLTSLRVKIEFLRSEPDLPAEQRAQIIEGAAVELEALGDLVIELVDLATSTPADEPPVVLDLGELVEDAARRARATTHRTITTSISGAIVSARPTMVRRAVANLVGNADKYSPAGAPIEISEFGGGVGLRDHGDGFADDDRERACGRFYRAGDVQHIPGSGIGLAIVKRAADVHGGRVWIDDAQGGGAVVGFSVGEPIESHPGRPAGGNADALADS